LTDFDSYFYLLIYYAILSTLHRLLTPYYIYNVQSQQLPVSSATRQCQLLHGWLDKRKIKQTINHLY